MGLEKPREHSELPGQRIIDSRSFPAELFVNPLQDIGTAYQENFGYPMSQIQSVICQQTWALWLALDRNPFRVPNMEGRYIPLYGKLRPSV
mgnify:CR=1 FL=1